MTPYIIYGLADPISHELRYIGKSTQGTERPKQHFWPSNYKRRRYVYNWIRGLLAQGLRPRIVVLMEFETPEPLYEAEQKLIAYHRSIGDRLTNLSDGGPGWTGPKSEEVRKKISAALKGRKRAITTEAHRRHLSESQRGKIVPDAVKLRMSVAKGGRPFVDQHGRRFVSIQGAARELGLHATNICRVLKGKLKTCGGLTFSYEGDPSTINATSHGSV